MSDELRRSGGRGARELRPVRLDIGVLKFAEGSAHVAFGDTEVLVAATVESRVPPFRSDSGLGWVTAEYSMLPRATLTRSTREVSRGRPSGRTSEIQRLIGRSLRAVVDMKRMGEITVTLDCDVLQADGGTRTASITGAYVALVEAMGKMFVAGDLAHWPLMDPLAAVSVGYCRDTLLLDLDYREDSEAQVDLNVVAAGEHRLVEVQGTAERGTFERSELDSMLDVALEGIDRLQALQRESLAPIMAEVEARRDRAGRPRATPKDEGQLWGEPK